MKLLRRAAVAGAFAMALAINAPTAHAFEIPFTEGDAHQCHNPHTGGGNLQIDWDGLGFDSGNPHGAVHFNQLTVSMTSQIADFGTLHKVGGNVFQTTSIMLGSGETAIFKIGGVPQSDILGMTLTSDGAVTFRGTQLLMGQDFTLTVLTTHGTLTFGLESIMGSSINFDRRGHVRDVNLRFCGMLLRLPPPPPPPPPPVPEPTSLLAIGLGALGVVRKVRRLVA